MKRMKPIFVISILLISFMLSGCFFDKSYSYEEISEYVLDNIEDLDKLIEDNSGFEKSVFFDYKDYLGQGTIVESAYSYSIKIIQFDCGGSGLVSDSKDYGFYYSKDDTTYGMEFDKYRQTTEEDGSVTYHSDDGISYLNTKRISPNWFYYYMEWH